MAPGALRDFPMNLQRDVPRISVIITAHNEGEELRRTVESVRENTQQPFEIVLVDDGSTDGSCDGLADDDLTVIRHDERTGVAA